MNGYIHVNNVDSYLHETHSKSIILSYISACPIGTSIREYLLDFDQHKSETRCRTDEASLHIWLLAAAKLQSAMTL